MYLKIGRMWFEGVVAAKIPSKDLICVQEGESKKSLLTDL